MSYSGTLSYGIYLKLKSLVTNMSAMSFPFSSVGPCCINI